MINLSLSFDDLDSLERIHLESTHDDQTRIKVESKEEIQITSDRKEGESITTVRRSERKRKPSRKAIKQEDHEMVFQKDGSESSTSQSSSIQIVSPSLLLLHKMSLDDSENDGFEEELGNFTSLDSLGNLGNLSNLNNLSSLNNLENLSHLNGLDTISEMSELDHLLVDEPHATVSLSDQTESLPSTSSSLTLTSATSITPPTIVASSDIVDIDEIDHIDSMADIGSITTMDTMSMDINHAFHHTLTTAHMESGYSSALNSSFVAAAAPSDLMFSHATNETHHDSSSSHSESVTNSNSSASPPSTVSDSLLDSAYNKQDVVAIGSTSDDKDDQVQQLQQALTHANLENQALLRVIQGLRKELSMLKDSSISSSTLAELAATASPNTKGKKVTLIKPKPIPIKPSFVAKNIKKPTQAHLKAVVNTGRITKSNGINNTKRSAFGLSAALAANFENEHVPEPTNSAASPQPIFLKPEDVATSVPSTPRKVSDESSVSSSKQNSQLSSPLEVTPRTRCKQQELKAVSDSMLQALAALKKKGLFNPATFNTVTSSLPSLSPLRSETDTINPVEPIEVEDPVVDGPLSQSSSPSRSHSRSWSTPNVLGDCVGACGTGNGASSALDSALDAVVVIADESKPTLQIDTSSPTAVADEVSSMNEAEDAIEPANRSMLLNDDDFGLINGILSSFCDEETGSAEEQDDIITKKLEDEEIIIDFVKVEPDSAQSPVSLNNGNKFLGGLRRGINTLQRNIANTFSHSSSCSDVNTEPATTPVKAKAAVEMDTASLVAAAAAATVASNRTMCNHHQPRQVLKPKRHSISSITSDLHQHKRLDAQVSFDASDLAVEAIEEDNESAVSDCVNTKKDICFPKRCSSTVSLRSAQFLGTAMTPYKQLKTSVHDCITHKEEVKMNNGRNNGHLKVDEEDLASSFLVDEPSLVSNNVDLSDFIIPSSSVTIPSTVTCSSNDSSSLSATASPPSSLSSSVSSVLSSALASAFNTPLESVTSNEESKHVSEFDIVELQSLALAGINNDGLGDEAFRNLDAVVDDKNTDRHDLTPGSSKTESLSLESPSAPHTGTSVGASATGRVPDSLMVTGGNSPSGQSPPVREALSFLPTSSGPNPAPDASCNPSAGLQPTISNAQSPQKPILITAAAAATAYAGSVTTAATPTAANSSASASAAANAKIALKPTYSSAHKKVLIAPKLLPKPITVASTTPAISKVSSATSISRSKPSKSILPASTPTSTSIFTTATATTASSKSTPYCKDLDDDFDSDVIMMGIPVNKSSPPRTTATTATTTAITTTSPAPTPPQSSTFINSSHGNTKKTAKSY